MYCQNCNTKIENDMRFCVNCGAELNIGSGSEPGYSSGNRIGFSDRISDPRVYQIVKKMKSSGTVFTLILAVIAIIVFTILGLAEVGGFEFPSSLYIGLAFAGLLVILALFQLRKSKKDITWDGTIIDKRIKKPTYAERKQGHLQNQYYIDIQRDDGKVESMVYTEQLFDYYKIGERVRHHGKMPASHILEKYDKSNETIVYCIACSSKNNMSDDLCYRCKCPLMN